MRVQNYKCYSKAKLFHFVFSISKILLNSDVECFFVHATRLTLLTWSVIVLWKLCYTFLLLLSLRNINYLKGMSPQLSICIKNSSIVLLLWITIFNTAKLSTQTHIHYLQGLLAIIIIYYVRDTHTTIFTRLKLLLYAHYSLFHCVYPLSTHTIITH